MRLSEDIQKHLHNYALEIAKLRSNFVPMELNKLHMTFVFVGSKCSYKEADEISNTVLNLPSDVYKFDSVRESFFPPGKKNLAVVLFKAPKNAVIARDSLACTLRVVESEWIPHVTLGKFVGKKSDFNIPQFPSYSFESDGIFVVNPYIIK
jgi:2'-5' RNA ligase